jgi:hypothetical protein
MANPNPSPETRFKPGHALGGKTSEQKRLEYETAEIAARARHRLVSIIGKALDKPDLDEAEALKLLNGDTLRLFKDSEDRAHGTPKQSVEHTGDAATPVQVVQHVIIDPPKRE